MLLYLLKGNLKVTKLVVVFYNVFSDEGSIPSASTHIRSLRLRELIVPSMEEVFAHNSLRLHTSPFLNKRASRGEPPVILKKLF